MTKKRDVASSQASTLHDHIRELRNRIFFLAVIFIGTSSIAYNYKDQLIAFLLKPLGNEKLIYLNPGGGFSFIFTVTMYVGAAITIPFAVFHLYRFVAPALPKSARKHSIIVLLSSIGLLIAGAAFGYFYAIPGALNFLNTFADGYVNPSLTADSYLNFILAYTAGLGILFQLPLILLFIHWVHPLKPGGLLKFERYMVLIAFIAAALITPTPDVLNQTIMALPIILMYQAGVIAVSISVYKTNRRRKKEAELNKFAVDAIDISPMEEFFEKRARMIEEEITQQVEPIRKVPKQPTGRQSFDIAPKGIQSKIIPKRPAPAQMNIPGRDMSVRPQQRVRNVDGVYRPLSQTPIDI
ncbi:MAG: twin-arginine translocase subunit TatC [Candidatus Saccharimonadales bacterium]